MSETDHKPVPAADKLAVREVLHPAVAKMMEHNPTPETMEKMMDLQERWEAGEAKRAYTSAMVKLRKDLPTWIKRDKVVDFTSAKGRTHYTHASLAAAMDAVVPALTAHGFSLSWVPSTDSKVTVKAVLTHADGHSEECAISAPPDTSGHKIGPQSVASTITLLQRYSALALLGIATADMEDPGPNLSPEDDLERVDTARNLKAAGALEGKGIKKAQAEKFIGKPFGEWTVGDLGRIREKWFPPKKAAPPPPDERQLGKLQMDSLRGYMKAYPNAIRDDAEALELFGHGLKRQVRKWSDITQADFDALKVLFDAIVKGDVIIEREPMRFTAVTEPGAGEGQTDIPF
jgi:hypothetical protein